MKVCVFGGTNPATNPKYYSVAQEMGKLMAKEKFEKVWGGNAHGVLAEINKKYVGKDVKSTLMIPQTYESDLETMDVENVVKTKDILSRAEAMLAAADVVVVMPGGIGTIFEFWTAVEVRRAEEYKFDIILLNYDDFYQYQLAHYGFIYEHGFTKIGAGGAPYRIDPKDLFIICTTPQEVIARLKELRKRHNTQ